MDEYGFKNSIGYANKRNYAEQSLICLCLDVVSVSVFLTSGFSLLTSDEWFGLRLHFDCACLPASPARRADRRKAGSIRRAQLPVDIVIAISSFPQQTEMHALPSTILFPRVV